MLHVTTCGIAAFPFLTLCLAKTLYVYKMNALAQSSLRISHPIT
jgi:hypothetical protein